MTSESNDNGPVALITGAGRGIGRAIATELAGRGYRLVLVARNEAELRQTCDACGGDARALVAPADVAELADLERVVASALKIFGRLDVVVHNAGYAPVLTIEQTTPDEWRKVIDTNLSAAVHLARLAWPAFRQAGGGVIVNISSLAARDPFPGFAAYGSAKAAIQLLGLALAREGASLGIRVHTIAPGSVETAMFRALMTPEQWPVEKTMDPAEVARVVGLCVAGDLRHTSGEVIYLHKTAP